MSLNENGHGNGSCRISKSFLDTENAHWCVGCEGETQVRWVHLDEGDNNDEHRKKDKSLIFLLKYLQRPIASFPSHFDFDYRVLLLSRPAGAISSSCFVRQRCVCAGPCYATTESIHKQITNKLFIFFHSDIFVWVCEQTPSKKKRTNEMNFRSGTKRNFALPFCPYLLSLIDSVWLRSIRWPLPYFPS